MSVVGAALRGFGKALKKFGKQKTSGTEVISSVKPNVPKTRVEKARSKLAIAKQKTKAAQARLDNTLFKIKQGERLSKD